MRFLGLDEAKLINLIHPALMISQSNYFVKIVNHELALHVIKSKDAVSTLELMILKRARLYFIGYGAGTIEATVGHELIQNHLTITSAESLTCGLFQSSLGAIPGISSVFSGGFVTYSNFVKHQLLSIPMRIIDGHGVVSQATAIWMAKQAQSILHTDLAVSFTGVAGPDSLEGQPSGTVWIGFAHFHHCIARLYHLRHGCQELLQADPNVTSATSDGTVQRNLIRRLAVKMGFKMIYDGLKSDGISN